MTRTLTSGCLLLAAFALPATAQDSTAFGLALGTPAGGNLVLKSDALGVPLQIAGGYWGDKLSGVELGVSVYERPDSFFQSVSLIAGYSDLEENSRESKIWRYGGVSFTFGTGGFYFEPGLTFGDGDYDNPQLTFQIGWLWGR
ncbi:hypothetical protein KUW04_07905 [Halomonas denitrificans]|nr:hypothetical protein [Halomonas denitrificans]